MQVELKKVLLILPSIKTIEKETGLNNQVTHEVLHFVGGGQTAF